MSDSVDHPEHYNKSNIEAIDVIEAWGLDFHLGNVVKYVCRCVHLRRDSILIPTANTVIEMGNPFVDGLEDLKKARWYLDRKIEWMEKNSSQ